MAFGADGLVHVWRDEVVSEADARRFAEADIFVVPTLSVMVSAEDSAVAELVQESDEALLSPIQRQTLAESLRGRPRGGRRSGDGERPAAARGRSAAGRGHGRPEPGNRGGNLHARGAVAAVARRAGECGGADGGDFGGGGCVRRRGPGRDRGRPSRRPCAGARRPRGRRVAQPRLSSRSGRMGTRWSAVAASQGAGLRPRLRPFPRRRWSRTSRTASRQGSAHGT